ncbi:hypothetical protein Cgig2_012697 [Carnegiea gigantea]|uniref:Uncharacterized protein n=1 Tax=Carnegiea gigantea TaxID=171969 RepID=A0A9Q1Q8L6_9CARY|nr:hypothetical protein Cgig2_012697 [Carnegiea gigantea]
MGRGYGRKKIVKRLSSAARDGLGCSSVGYGATQEIGPFLGDSNDRELKFNPFSWNKEVKMLFLESPVGVGFSYTNSSSDFDNIGDEFTATDAYEFLQNWFLKYPTYQGRAFYIARESYAATMPRAILTVPKALTRCYDSTRRLTYTACTLLFACQTLLDNPCIYFMLNLLLIKMLLGLNNGDTNGRVPVLSTRYSLNALGLPITKPWRPWYHEKKVNGWYQEYKGLIFATFRGAGHIVPIFTPSNSLALFPYFLQGPSHLLVERDKESYTLIDPPIYSTPSVERVFFLKVYNSFD